MRASLRRPAALGQIRAAGGAAYCTGEPPVRLARAGAALRYHPALMSEAFICDAVRTPIGRYGGALA
ncbi:MAG: hypothetical protein WAK94_17795, partial [Steroidobacteraceae bacterium]